jgi:thiosulfate/3-mercaptopyruvate sulfurtransferase
MESQSPLLVTTEWLAAHLDGRDFVLIDAGEPVAFRRAHIPGAVGVPHPYLKGSDDPRLVMGAEEFQGLARAWGVSDGTRVIVYDDNASLHAARVWWVFRRYGHDNVQVVDGGFTAWLDEGRPVTAAPHRPEPGNFTSRPRDSEVIAVDELKSAVESGTAPAIWDTRAPDEWDARNARGNARAGHVPGAHQLEWRNLVEGPPARRFLPLEEIRARLVAAGIEPDGEAVTYCQAGIRAAFGHFVLALLGNERARTYDGSMGEWANREDTPLVMPGR